MPCECGEVYKGQAKRSIEVRLEEHKRSLTKLDPEKSFAEDHRIQWDKTDVVHKQRNYKKRLILEAREGKINKNNFSREDGFH